MVVNKEPRKNSNDAVPVGHHILRRGVQLPDRIYESEYLQRR